MTLEEIRGQHRALSQLTRAARGERFAHAYLFSGPDGVGKTTTAKALAKGLICTEKTGVESCERCSNCFLMEVETHPDFIVLPRDEGKSIGIDDIRQLESRLSHMGLGQQSVVLLRQVERMSLEAINAFLKTLEEPPSPVTFFLTTAKPDALPTTLRSRLQEVFFSPLCRQDILAVLSQEYPSAEAKSLALAADFSHGSLRQARALMTDERLYALEQNTMRRLRQLASCHPGILVTDLGPYEKGEAKAQVEMELSICERWFSAALLSAFGIEREESEAKSESPTCPPLVARFAIERLRQTRRDLASHLDPALLYLLCLQEIALAWQANTPPS